ncbi:glycoside hydrolase family 38 C-terminal domain-containing protein [Actinomadura kijaniata]|uniref:glycoside hydrolase family 38 N-terminal domain-containing protein n=1 Tax=Actinomadura kijaniata TaxID=46161 RepID=UPI00082B6407|nr:glycoside hydrolase family 38 C-terminal domain-containing protein [Actinomadura kijaniata]
MRLTDPAPGPLVVVPHTHWDREWYLPFQRFRLRLVALLDEVLDRMERDPRWHFTLDGQTAAVDDYLEIRPERRDRVAALVREGRLAVGPWQILHDEFLCSGETIVRNLELGVARANALGAAMMVGYLPDQFGHCAQMPQILRRAGIAHACVWRGVPAAVTASAFAWEAPDGSVVRTQYLPEGGYGNAASLLEDPALLPRRAADLAERMRAWRPEGGPLLAMYGSDHAAPVPDLADRLAGAGLPVRLDTLAGFLAGEPADVTGLTRVRGELRSHARANILPGVLSARVPLKQAMGRAERLTARYAEPLDALWWPESARRFLDMAWRRIVEVSCHDSVTGCGSDETAEQVAARTAEAEQLGRAVCDLVTSGPAAAVPAGGHLVFNPTPRRRTALVVLDVPGDAPLTLEDPAGRLLATQVLESAPTVLDDAMHPAADLPLVLERVYGRVLFGQRVRLWSVEEGTLTFQVARHADTPFDIADVRAALGDAEGEWRVRIIAEPRHTVAALVEMPPLGLTAVRPITKSTPSSTESGTVGGTPGGTESGIPGGTSSNAASGATSGATTSGTESGIPGGIPGGTPSNTASGATSGGVGGGVGSVVGGVVGDVVPVGAPVRVEGRVLDNGLLRVEIRDDGTLTLRTPDGRTAEGLARLVDGGDLGDTYNHAPPARDLLVDVPEAVRVGAVWTGPLVAALDVVRTYRWPAAGDAARDARSEATERTAVVTRVELRAGEPFLRLGVAFDNRCADHRVRLHLPLPRRAGSSFAEGQFAVVERGLTAEGGFGERPVPTFPASGFVAAGGLAALLEHPAEYEIVDNELAVTLLRSVGYLSRDRNAHRDQPAGPQLPTPRAQCRGEHAFSLAVLPYAGDRPGEEVLAAAEEYRHEPLTAEGYGPGGGALPPARAGLAVSGTGVVLSALRDRDGWTEVRLVAETPEPTVAVLSGAFGRAVRTDLLGRPGEDLAVAGGAVRLPMLPWEIVTMRLRA